LGEMPWSSRATAVRPDYLKGDRRSKESQVAHRVD
jgi:hypothetical protein